jgi:hypothetical protein
MFPIVARSAHREIKMPRTRGQCVRGNERIASLSVGTSSMLQPLRFHIQGIMRPGRGFAGASPMGHIPSMEEALKPKLLVNPFTDPGAKRLARKRLFARAAMITLAGRARRAAKKRRRQTS